VSGTLDVSGLSAPVRIVRDRWGTAHIYARNQNDLFVAQGFVQAQDRLFQMDLWRRAAQGRLAQILGPNFVERDAMTRRVQYAGDLDAEWASYGPETQAIATAFVRGINAWVARARARPPEAFVLAGWLPDVWLPADLLNRTDAFVESGDAVEEIQRAKMSDVIAAAIRRVGAAPFLVGAEAPEGLPRPRAPGRAEAGRGLAIAVSEARGRFDQPSTRYLVHLNAPGWNVIGVTAPWLPGVAVGHNERIAWGMTPLAVDTQDVYAEPASASNLHRDALVVKGRSEPLPFDTERTPHGIVVASDRELGLTFAVRWSGFEPGTAAELGALALDRAASWTEFRAALARWKMPARRVVYADADGNIGFQDAALVPLRDRDREWRGWLTVDSLPHAFNPPSGTVASSGPPSAGARAGDTALFAHILSTSGARRRRLDIGPIVRPSPDDSPFRATFDPANWDRSRAINAPGQSESPDSSHFSDLAQLWSQGQLVPLAFSERSVQRDAEATLVLTPPLRR
jgi:penicillin amidase